MTIEQVGTPLQQEVFTLKAQIADQSGLADAVRAMNNLGAAQVRKDTPSPVDVKGLGRSQGVLWQRGGFSTVVEEDGGILCWRDPRV